MMNRYVVIWERLANSGIIEVEANTSREAMDKTGLNKNFCKLTCYQIVGNACIDGKMA